jgi:hypothetical protein
MLACRANVGRLLPIGGSRESWTAMIPLWLEVKEFYREAAGREPRLAAMVRLVDDILASRYASGLFPWTSMYVLCVTQGAAIKPYDGPFLRIAPHLDGPIEFRYLDTSIADRQRHRLIKEGDAFARLELFIDRLHWFARIKPQRGA